MVYYFFKQCSLRLINGCHATGLGKCLSFLWERLLLFIQCNDYMWRATQRKPRPTACTPPSHGSLKPLFSHTTHMTPFPECIQQTTYTLPLARLTYSTVWGLVYDEPECILDCPGEQHMLQSQPCIWLNYREDTVATWLWMLQSSGTTKLQHQKHTCP